MDLLKWRFCKPIFHRERATRSRSLRTNPRTAHQSREPYSSPKIAVTADGKTPGQFQLAHTKGANFLSVRALVRKAATNLNIRWNKHTYVFELVESETPILAMNLEDRSESEAVLPAPAVRPTQLLALLDTAKAFPLLRKQHPDVVADAQARTFDDKPQVTDFDDYEIRIEEIFRFNLEDTLVFHVTLRNKSDREIRYLPKSFYVRVGNRLYYQSVSDAPGLLPPHAASTVYFAITGTTDGGRNELSLKNDFSVLVSRLPSPPIGAATELPPPPSQPPPQPSGMTPDQELRVREILRRTISGLQDTNAPSATQTRP